METEQASMEPLVCATSVGEIESVKSQTEKIDTDSNHIKLLYVHGCNWGESYVTLWDIDFCTAYTGLAKEKDKIKSETLIKKNNAVSD